MAIVTFEQKTCAIFERSTKIITSFTKQNRLKNMKLRILQNNLSFCTEQVISRQRFIFKSRKECCLQDAMAFVTFEQKTCAIFE